MGVIGITGSIASGKSTLRDILAARLSAEALDADFIARDLLENDSVVRARVAAEISPLAYPGGGPADRAEIRRVIYGDPAAKSRLEGILHPLVRAVWTAAAVRARRENRNLIVDIPLLFETDAAKHFDFVITVACSQEVQRARISDRGLDPDLAARIIGAQMPVDEKIVRTSQVVWNDGGLEALDAQAREFVSGMRAGSSPVEGEEIRPATPFFSVPLEVRTWVEVDPGALTHNLAFVRRVIGPAPEILAVIKANAYGHGTRLAAAALAHGVSLFGVATLSEAREVLDARTGREIVLLSPCLPEERKEAVDLGLIVTVSGADEAESFAAIGNARVNFKVDTGMGRVGAWWPDAARTLERVAGRVAVHSISTHLPSSDADESFTRAQLERFARLAGELRKLAPEAKLHSLNSAGALRFPQFSGDIVRVGLLLYGCSPLPEFQRECRPALAWKARVTLVRELPAGSGVSYGRTFVTARPTRIAVLAVGYADGFPRQVSGRGACVLIGGLRCPVLGRVTMDQIVADVTDAGDVMPGEAAVLIGSQGRETITASEIAGCADTIPWDIFTGIRGRVERISPAPCPSAFAFFQPAHNQSAPTN